MDLSGRWQALAADDDIRRSWLDDASPDEAWEPIEVPGHWRSTPAFADHDGPVLYRTRFAHEAPAEGERAWLTLDGCFYQGDVWLDGAYVGDTEGYFFPHTFEVTDQLRARGEHLLGVDLTCAPPTDLSAKRQLTGLFQHGSGPEPDWNPGGIWRPVRVERTGPVRICHLRVVCREASAEQAVLGLRGVLDAAEGSTVTVRTTVSGVEHVEEHVVAAGENQLSWRVAVPSPALWWPHALGDQPLHDVAVEVTLPGAEAPSDRRTLRTGFRQVALRGWVASVNGERLFLKGATQGPTRRALGDADPDELCGDVALAVDAGLDLLRVHAHISRPELYDAADEAGLLLWQDMPLHHGYARTVRKQAVRQAREAVDLLGHHPSVAVWCGHDEPLGRDEPTEGGGPLTALRRVAAQELPTWNSSVLDRSIKRAIQRHDGTRPVIAHSGVLPRPPRLDGTDSHLYFGWLHGDERQLAGFARLVPRMVRFVSELGAQAVPETDAFLEPERWPDLDWERLGRRHGLQKAAFDRHVPPGDFATYAEWKAATQRYQATLVRRQVEELRRLKYRPTGGVAVAALADGHPAVSFALLDHERVPKPGWDALRAACAPVIVVADRLPAAVAPGDPLAIDVHVVSDRRQPVAGAEVEVRASWTGGEHVWRYAGDVEADSCARVGTVQLVVPDAPGPLDLVLRLVDADGTEVATNADRTLVVVPG